MHLCSSVKYQKRATLADCSPVLLSHKDSNLKLQNQNLTCCQLHHGTNFKCLLSKDGANLQSYFDMSKGDRAVFFDGEMAKVGEIWRAGNDRRTKFVRRVEYVRRAGNDRMALSPCL